MDPNSLSKQDTTDLRSDEPSAARNQDYGSHSPQYYEEMKKDRKHSGPGIASFIISMTTLLGYVVCFLVAGSMASTIMDEAGNLNTDASDLIVSLGLAVLALVALNVIGVVVGIIGISLRNRRKVFGIIGTIINALFILLFMLVISIALLNAGAF